MSIVRIDPFSLPITYRPKGGSYSMRLTFRLLFCGIAFVFTDIHLVAQSAPDVIWSTNAHSDFVVAVSFSADSARLGSGGSQDGNAKVWALTNGTLLRAIHLPNQERVLSVALSASGSQIATGGDDGRTRVWNVSDGSLSWGVHDSFRLVSAVAFSPNDLNLASGLTGSGLLLATADGQSGDYLNGQAGDVTGVNFSRDSKLLTSSSSDGLVRLWQVSGANLIRSLVHPLSPYTAHLPARGA